MLRMTVDLAAFERAMTDLERRQLPFALSRGLNDMAEDVRQAVVVEQARVFDRPTPYTQNAWTIERATRGQLFALVLPKTAQRARHYLNVEASGGVRPATALESLLRSRLRSGGVVRAAVPASGARLDGYGNWSSGQRGQVLAALQSQRDGTSPKAAKRRKGGRAKAEYFVPREGSTLSPGVWVRQGKASIRKVLSFTQSSAAYRQRLDLEAVATRRAPMFEGYFARRLAEALASAR